MTPDNPSAMGEVVQGWIDSAQFIVPPVTHELHVFVSRGWEPHPYCPPTMYEPVAILTRADYEALLAEVERLRAARPVRVVMAELHTANLDLTQRLHDAEAANADLRTRLSEAERDAGARERNDTRYRWLRDHCSPWRLDDAVVHVTMKVWLGLDDDGKAVFSMRPGAKEGVGVPSLDTAVDAAILAQKEQNKC